jgi:hypothetical protein
VSNSVVAVINVDSLITDPGMVTGRVHRPSYLSKFTYLSKFAFLFSRSGGAAPEARPTFELSSRAFIETPADQLDALGSLLSFFLRVRAVLRSLLPGYSAA